MKILRLIKMILVIAIVVLTITSCTPNKSHNFQVANVEVQKVSIDGMDSDSVNLESVSKTLEMVKSKDKAFVDSLFGGEMNPSTTTNIDTAMVTVEAFIQLDRNFDEFVLVTKSITNDATVSNSTKYNDQVLEGIRIFVSSFGYYNFRCIKEIIKTYNDIIDSMSSRTPASGVKEVETYQLF